MHLNRSKSSNIFRYPSLLDDLNCQDIQQTQQIQEIRGNLWKQQCLDLEWIKIIQNKYRQRMKTKINIKKQKPKHTVKQPIQKLDLYQLTGSLNYKQKTVTPTVKINKQQNLTFSCPKIKLPSSKPSHISSCPQSPMSQVKLSINSGLNQQSTNQQQQKQLSVIKNKIEIQPTHRIDNQKNDIKMLEYEIEIQRLNLDIQKLKAQFQRQREINVNKNQRQLEDSIVNKEDVQELKRQLMEQIQNKNNVIKQRNMLMAQLNQVLKQNYNQQIILKQKTICLQSQLCSYQALAFEQKTQIMDLKNILNYKQQSYKQISDTKQKLCLQLKQVKIENQCMEIQIQKVEKQNRDLNIVLNDLQQKYRIQCNELQDQCRINQQLRKIITDKDSLMDRYKDKIYNLENSNSQLKANLQQLVNQIQTIRRQSTLTQNHLQQLKIYEQRKTQQLINLQKIIKKQQSIQQNSLQIQIKTNKQLTNFIHQIANILNITQQITHQYIVEQIKNITHQYNYYKQTFHDYREIIEMFNINIQDSQCHQKLIYQILQFRNNMGVLVKKIKTMDNKIYYLAEENRKLNSRAKHGYYQALRGLEKIVQQQNQEIIKYRLKLRNFHWRNQVQQIRK